MALWLEVKYPTLNLQLQNYNPNTTSQKRTSVNAYGNPYGLC